MDLTKQSPRSPNEMMAGIVSLPRMIDKTHAYNDGTLGEYDVDCPHDRPVLALLGTDFKTFAEKVKDLHYDDAAIEAWAKSLLASKGAAEIQSFNSSRRSWAPEPGTPSAQFFNATRDAMGKRGEGITTWFALLDADEGRVTAGTPN